MRLNTIVLLACICLGLSRTYAQNTNYISNRTPLQPTPFVALPLGSITPKGWLATQLTLQKDGLTGHSEALYSELKADAAWLGGKAPDSDWERPTYYLRGLIGLAYSLHDAELKQRAQKWIDWALNSQAADGSFGPTTNNDWWARMPMLYALCDYQEATHDARVVPFLTKYFRYQLAELSQRPLKEWASARAADNVDVIFWLYNRTGDAFLLTLATKIKEQAYNYTDIFSQNTFITDFHGDFFPKHGVNVAQAYKYGPVFYQQTHAAKDKDAFLKGIKNLEPYHTHITGMNSCTEFLSGNSSIQGVELCSTAERMFCDEIAIRILGDATIGDELEKIAFNQLPAGISPDFRQHQYYTLPNQVQSKDGHNGFGQDYANGVVPGPYSGYPCCRFNLHMAWPKYTQHCWMATAANGLVAAAYAPSSVQARVENNIPVTITEETDYPFEEQIRFTVTLDRTATFPLQLRIPAWCTAPVVKVNGKVQKGVTSGTYYTISRTWKNNDKVVLDLPMTVKTSTWVNHSVGIERGPLIYTLQMEEQWKRKKEHTIDGIDFSEYEVLPANDWNYGLVVDPKAPANSITIERTAMPENPFKPETTPIRLKVKARKIEGWGLAANDVHAAEPPINVQPTGPEQQVTLVPFGAQRIRVTYFPLIGQPVATEQRAFADPFTGNGKNPWVNFAGGWQQAGGKYVSESYNLDGAKSVVTTTHFDNLTMDATVTILDDATEGGVLFRTSSPAVGVDAYKGYYAAVSTKGSLILGKSNNAWQSLKEIPATIVKNKPYHLRIVAKGDRIQVYLDDMTTPQITVTDATYTAGAIGLRQYSGTDTRDPSGKTVIYEKVSAQQTN
jgi:hypothetical protein